MMTMVGRVVTGTVLGMATCGSVTTVPSVAGAVPLPRWARRSPWSRPMQLPDHARGLRVLPLSSVAAEAAVTGFGRGRCSGVEAPRPSSPMTSLSAVFSVLFVVSRQRRFWIRAVSVVPRGDGAGNGVCVLVTSDFFLSESALVVEPVSLSVMPVFFRDVARFVGRLGPFRHLVRLRRAFFLR